ncbi:MAG TPA: hypothetical protein VGS41_06915 [Chthonomonadales bacterium]|nr:hypothetical protein [Chthonomonadales bacterium]
MNGASRVPALCKYGLAILQIAMAFIVIGCGSGGQAPLASNNTNLTGKAIVYVAIAGQKSITRGVLSNIHRTRSSGPATVTLTIDTSNVDGTHTLTPATAPIRPDGTASVTATVNPGPATVQVSLAGATINGQSSWQTGQSLVPGNNNVTVGSAPSYQNTYNAYQGVVADGASLNLFDSVQVYDGAAGSPTTYFLNQNFDSVAPGAQPPAPFVNIWSGKEGVTIQDPTAPSQPNCYLNEAWADWNRHDGVALTPSQVTTGKLTVDLYVWMWDST